LVLSKLAPIMFGSPVALRFLLRRDRCFIREVRRHHALNDHDPGDYIRTQIVA
jgi:hypothetical protein